MPANLRIYTTIDILPNQVQTKFNILNILSILFIRGKCDK